jgi:hypothetical protein
MARRRGGNSTPISLFSFQDIITSVTGIMILVTMMMTLELLQRKVSAPAPQTAKIIDELRPAVDQGDQEIAKLQQQLARDEQTLRELAGIDQNQVRRAMDDLERLTRQLQSDVQTLRGEEAHADSRVRRSEAEKTQRASDAKTLQELTERVRKTQRQFEELKSSNRVIYNVSSSASKSAWLVQIGDDQLLTAPVGKPAASVFSGSPEARTAEFLRWAASRDPKSEYFMLLVKPGGVASFRTLLQGLTSKGFQVGFDLIGASQMAVDPKTGASPR